MSASSTTQENFMRETETCYNPFINKADYQLWLQHVDKKRVEAWLSEQYYIEKANLELLEVRNEEYDEEFFWL